MRIFLAFCISSAIIFNINARPETTSATTETSSTSTKPKLHFSLSEFKFRYDDGVVEDDISPEIEEKERGTLHIPRNILTGIKNKVQERVAKVFNFVTTSTGADTNKTFFSGSVDKFKNHIRTIYPGTRWCGGGDIAKNNSDLGTFEETDKCCRAHDKCFDGINAGEKKYGLENTGLFTRSHCNCDVDFYNCLKDAKSVVAGNIGFTYFTVLGPQCFKEEYVATGCERYSRGKCLRYRLDHSKGKLHQWFDSPLYIVGV